MTKPPPVPEQNRSPKGPGDESPPSRGSVDPKDRERNLQQQGRQGNIKQNTTNQGFQQDR
jgi:hypothetical protein